MSSNPLWLPVPEPQPGEVRDAVEINPGLFQVLSVERLPEGGIRLAQWLERDGRRPPEDPYVFVVSYVHAAWLLPALASNAGTGVVDATEAFAFLPEIQEEKDG